MQVQLLFAALGFVCGIIVAWLFNASIETAISPSDLLDSLVTLLVGLFITREVAALQNQVAKQVSEEQQKAQQISANLRVEKDIVIEQLRSHLIKLQQVSILIEQYRANSLSSTIGTEIAATFRNLNINLRDIKEMIDDYTLPVNDSSVETLLKQQHDLAKKFTSKEFEVHNAKNYLQANDDYRSLVRALHRLIHVVNTL
jgi:hypothetical protein